MCFSQRKNKLNIIQMIKNMTIYVHTVTKKERKRKRQEVGSARKEIDECVDKEKLKYVIYVYCIP